MNNSALAGAVLKLVDDPDLNVRCQLALSLGEWSDPRAAEALARLAVRDMNDEWFRAAVLSSAVPHAETILEAVLKSSANAAGRGELIGQLTGIAVATRKTEDLGPLLLTITPADATSVSAWQFVALDGLQDALDRKRVNLADLVRTEDSILRAALERLRAAHAAAHRVATDGSRDEAMREAAIRLLGRGFNPAEKDLPLLIELAKTSPGARVQKAAVDRLRTMRGVRVAELVLADWQRLAPSARGQLIELLCAREEWIQPLLAALEQGRVGPGEVPAVNRQRLVKHANSAIKQRAGKLFAVNGSEGRREVVARYQSVLAMKGDAARGAAVFAKNCAACHAFGGQGFEVGPDLAVWRTKPPQDLLVAVLDPGSVVEPRFVNYLIETKDDRSLSGVIAVETATALTLVQAGGVKETILRHDIKEIRASTLSLMPEGFEQVIPPPDMADLIAYMQK